MEVKKMMQNANVKKHWNSTPYGGIEEYYPPFTAEKQIELIKWLGIRDELNLYQNKATNDWVFYDHEKDAIHYSFEYGLASWINYLWEDLTEEEKQQIKEILE